MSNANFSVTGAPKDINPPSTNVDEASSSKLMVTPAFGKRLTASTSNMEMSSVSMPDISEEDTTNLMDTPGYYLGKWLKVATKIEYVVLT